MHCLGSRIATGQVAMPRVRVTQRVRCEPQWQRRRLRGVERQRARGDDSRKPETRLLPNSSAVLALVGFPKTPDEQIRENRVTNEGERTIVQAVYRMYVSMTRH